LFAKSNLVQILTAVLNLEFQIYSPWLFGYGLKFLNLHEFGLIKFNLSKAKFLNKISQI